MIGKTLRLWRTVRHLRPVQVYGRAWFRLARPKPDLAPAPALRPLTGPWRAPALRQTSLTGPGAFRFLNEAGTLAADGWDNPARAKLWRYNQHYFDDLVAVDAPARADWHHALVHDWIAGNPPATGSGWEPYPTSLRIVNWVKWALAGHPLPDAAIHSLAVQARWLRKRLEWHLLGNHLFANAKALVYAGLYFDGPEAAHWLDTGLRILEAESVEQILPDGGHFELSPMYHALAVQDLLDLVNIARAFGRDGLATTWGTRVPAMLDWLATMSHPDGDLAFFNDTAMGIAPDTAQIAAYAHRLGHAPGAPSGTMAHLAASGYARLAAGPAVLIADLARIGPDYLPGHAHADTLSFEMSLHGQRVIVNSGTSVYGNGPDRQHQRGTAAHSTLTLDGLDSSEIWSGFRVGRRARPFDVAVRRDGAALVAEGAHDGYRHLPGRPVHRRVWRIEAGGVLVSDAVEGAGRHAVAARFHLAPGLRAERTGPTSITVNGAGGEPVFGVSVEGGVAEIEPSSWHPQFGVTIPTQAIRVHADTDLPCNLRTRLQWGPV